MKRRNRFLRLRNSILDSSLMLEDLPTRWLWVTMLILADDAETGVVDMPVERLAVQAGLTVRQASRALERLSLPDPMSRSQREGGRRIAPLEREEGMAPRGWRLVNWEDMKKEAEREAAAARQRHHRKNLSDSEENGECHGDVTDGHAESPAVTLEAEERQSKSTGEGEEEKTGGADVSAPPPARVRDPKRKGRAGQSPPVYLNPPTVEDVRAFIATRYNGKAHLVDAYEFVRKNTTTGWVDKQGRPYRNWKAVVDTWFDYATGRNT